jgi:hypothetical protein
LTRFRQIKNGSLEQFIRGCVRCGLDENAFPWFAGANRSHRHFRIRDGLAICAIQNKNAYIDGAGP